MTTGIVGFLIGTGLFIVGFVHHDKDEDFFVHRGERLHWYADRNDRENVAYIIGMAGAAIATVSIKHLLNRDKPKKIKKSHWWPQFTIGSGLTYGGLWLHELKQNHDWNATIEYTESLRTAKMQDNIREHLGFGVGAIGSAFIGLSVKQLWDSRNRKKLDFEQVYMKFRQRLRR